MTGYAAWGLRGQELHDLIIDEVELGVRAARAIESETEGFGPVFDRQADAYFKMHPYLDPPRGDAVPF